MSLVEPTLPWRCTKIVATLGPACSDPDTLFALMQAGMNVARINGSHGDHATHAKTIALVRAQAARLGRPIGILFDLQGPKIRIGRFAHPPREVAMGDLFSLAVGRPAEGDELPTDYPFLDRDVQVGQPLLINDGALASTVVAVRPGLVQCRALNPGRIEQRKGINLPESTVSAPAITDKDSVDARFAVAQQVDMIALSFVRRAADIEALKVLMRAAGRELPVIAKIEKPQALTYLDEILKASWGVMVARGDLGVELSPADVPMAQKRIIQAANQMGKPVITATQMLDSMTHNPRPTRAEASDVANAVLDGSDAVMLSQETAMGTYPVQTVATMVEIIQATEAARLPNQASQARASRDLPNDDIPAAVARAGCDTARRLNARAIVTLTETGRMALLAAQERPAVPILAFARDARVQHCLTLLWGVRAFLAVASDSTQDQVRALDQVLLHNDLAAPGDRLVLLVGKPGAPTGSTNLMMVHRVGAADGV